MGLKITLEVYSLYNCSQVHEIFGQKCHLPFIYLYLYVFLDPYNLFSISNNWKYCLHIHTCQLYIYIVLMFLLMYMTLVLNIQGIYTKCTRLIQIYQL